MVFLVFAICLGAFAGCKNNETAKQHEGDPQKQDGDGSESNETATDKILYDKVPELDFEGYSFRVLIGTFGLDGQTLFPEEEIGDVLNDTIYLRNRKIEGRFNIEFKTSVVDLGSLQPALRKDVKAGADSYDEYMQIDRYAYTSAAEQLLYPVSDLPYVDLNQPYWCYLPNKQLTVANKLYFGFSDEMLTFFEATLPLYFNKKQAQDLGIEDLYGLVRSGDWVYDKFFETAKLAVRDADGDGQITEKDHWGIAGDGDTTYYCFWNCAGLYSVEKDKNDIPYFAIPENPKFFEIGEKVIDMLNSRSGLLMNSHKTKLPSYGGPATRSAESQNAKVSFFKNGHCLFMIGTISEMVKLRDMPDDFGVLPFPKYTVDQGQYYTRVYGGFPFVVPTTVQNPEIVGAIMEAMACESRNTVIPAYFESSLQNKYSRDTDTAEMLDLIINTRLYDLGDTIWYDQIRLSYTEVFESGQNTFASFTEKNQAKYQQIIEKAVNAILGG